MVATVTIPKGDYDSAAPCWIPTVRHDNGQPCKPIIKCQCGQDCGIGLHHVHPNGRVTNSFFNSKQTSFMHGGKTYSHAPGCGWHVYLILKDYDQGDFPPRTD